MMQPEEFISPTGPVVPGKLTDDVKLEIDTMTHFRMAWLVRFAPVGSPYFEGEVGDYFMARFGELGGMTPEISRAIGNDNPL